MATVQSTQKLSFPKGRVFYFIDETGDPGHPSHETSSKYYQLNMTIISREGLVRLHKFLAAFRYFKDTGKELKKYSRDAEILAKIFSNLVHNHNVSFLTFIMTKQNYVGQYLFESEINNFRGHIIQESIKFTFSEIIDIHPEDNNLEIIIDRYLESEIDEHLHQLVNLGVWVTS